MTLIKIIRYVYIYFFNLQRVYSGIAKTDAKTDTKLWMETTYPLGNEQGLWYLLWKSHDGSGVSLAIEPVIFIFEN